MNTGWMNGMAADWRTDLEASRDLSELEKQHFGFVLAWFETWRLKRGLDPCREAAIRFWREQVKAKARKEWQLERGAEAMRWHEQWLKFCVDQGREVCSVGERMRRAVMNAGARRGLAVRTRETYAGWVGRFGEWVGSAREAMDPERARDWLTLLVSQQQVSFATQKQALNALVFFYRDICGLAEVNLEVRLRKTEKRVPVVMTCQEVLAVLDKLEGDVKLAAEIQSRRSGGRSMEERWSVLTKFAEISFIGGGRRTYSGGWPRGPTGSWRASKSSASRLPRMEPNLGRSEVVFYDSFSA